MNPQPWDGRDIHTLENIIGRGFVWSKLYYLASALTYVYNIPKKTHSECDISEIISHENGCLVSGVAKHTKLIELVLFYDY